MEGTRKKRRASYVVRKEEVQSLKMQVGALQRQEDELRVQAGLALETTEEQKLELWTARTTGGMLQSAICDQQMAVAGLQTKMLQLQEQGENPLYSHIHLVKDWRDRTKVLVNLKDEMIARGCRYVETRSRPFDLMKPHFSDHRYEDKDGNFCGEQFKFFHFVGVGSLKQVFEAVKFFVRNMEISISERLGHTTVREDFDCLDGASSISNNYRLLSTDENAVTTERNIVTFTEYFEQRDEFGGCPCAVLVTDSVDEDELYPYSARDRIRRDVSAAIVLTEFRRKVFRKKQTLNTSAEFRDTVSEETSQSGEMVEETVVLMRRAAFAKSYRPAFEVPMATMDAVQGRASNWGDVMVQTIREFIQES